MQYKRRPDNKEKGVLLPVFSLPSKYGIGCFSKEARAFIDWLRKTGHAYWQILPLNPTGVWDSPYQPLSSFAGQAYFIDPEQLAEQGLITAGELAGFDFSSDPTKVDYEKLYSSRLQMLHLAHERFRAQRLAEGEDYCRFVAENDSWLEDYAMFMALRDAFGKELSWDEWPDELRNREPRALKEVGEKYAETISFHEWCQYEFFSQWTALKEYANRNGVKIIGDMSVYVSYDSADCWADPEQFQLDGELRPTMIAGVPPDGFSDVGQLWGNPLYDWEKMQEDDYRWWISRIRQSFVLYDVIRLDHFQGYAEYYSCRADAENAIDGLWRPGPGIDLFLQLEKVLSEGEADAEGAKAGEEAKAVNAGQGTEAADGREGAAGVEAGAKAADAGNAGARKALERLTGRFVAEDLGTLRESVCRLLDETGFPGTKVLQFAFDGNPENVYLPENYNPNCVVYTGTHDNDTTAGWFRKQSPDDRAGILQFLGCTAEDAWWLVLESDAALSRGETLCEPKYEKYAALLAADVGDWTDRGVQQAGSIADHTSSAMEQNGSIAGYTASAAEHADSTTEQNSSIAGRTGPVTQCIRLHAEQNSSIAGRTRSDSQQTGAIAGDTGSAAEQAASIAERTGPVAQCIRLHADRAEGIPDPAILATDGLIARALNSRARIAIIPLQDYLHLGTEARVNIPGTIGNNWCWRTTGW